MVHNQCHIDTITSSDNPRAASQAANTNRIIGIILARVRWVFRIISDAVKDVDSTIPSRHKSDDIKRG